MSGQRGHKKSRNGCVRCKIRRVKCSEEHPACAACVRHSIECNYDPGKVVSTTKPNASTAPTPLRLDSAGITRQLPVVVDLRYAHEPPESNQDRDRQVLELYLLHNYTAVVALTFPSEQNPASRRIYSIDSVRLAFQHTFLLNTVFAISALYLSLGNDESYGPLQSSQAASPLVIPERFQCIDFAKVHRLYLDQALREQREALHSISSENVEALGLASILLSVISFRLDPDPETRTGSDYIPPTLWLRMSGAIRTIWVTAHQLSLTSSIFDAITSVDKVDYRGGLSGATSFFNPENIDPFKPILQFYESSHPLGSTSEEHLRAYSAALALVGTTYQAVKRKEPRNQICRRLTSFGPLSPSMYVSLLERSEPCALAIFAILMGLIKCAESYWFFQGLAEREIIGVQIIMPAEWQWALEWPLKVLADGFAEAEKVLHREAQEEEPVASKAS